MHVGFLPLIPKLLILNTPQCVYTSMLNFVKIIKQLNQDALPIFFDKGIFKILVDIYLQIKDEF